MSIELSYDPNSSPVAGAITVGPHLVDLPTGLANTLSNPDLTAVVALDQKYWKVSGGAVVAMTGGEQTSVDAAEATAATASARSSAQAIMVSPSDFGKLLRAMADVLVSRDNLHVAWEAALSAAVAGAATLATLKTAVAAITPVPSVTLAQAKTAILNEITAGTEGD